MKRVTTNPRPGFLETIQSQGLVYPETEMPDGTLRPYWFEGAYYELDPTEVDYLERVTEDLHFMCVDAAHELATGRFGDLGLPSWALNLVKRSLLDQPFSIYGRFDIAWSGTGDAKMLEYNADTPTGLVESSVAQWFWLQDTHPDKDQWNSLHERLVDGWRRFAQSNHGNETVYFANFPDNGTGEELMTVAYMRDTATEAGLTTVGIEIPEIGYDSAMKRFVDKDDRWMGSVFKLYPWENMLHEEFGKRVDESWGYTQWIEPLWKVVLSNKALLAALWEMFPNHPNLLPAYLNDKNGLEHWIAKPLHGREGDGIYASSPDGLIDQRKPDGYGDEGYCFQQWHQLPKFDGNYAVLGSWIIDGRPAGVGIRESDGPITDYFARFLPHVINAPAPTAEQRAEWLAGTV